MIKVNGLGVSRIPVNGKETLRVMKNGKLLWSGSGLPAGYTLLEYIENNNDAWINTNYIANGGMKACIGIMPYDTSKQYIFFGSHNPSSNSSDKTWQRNCIAINNSNQWEIGKSSYVFKLQASAAINVKHDVEFDTIISNTPYAIIDKVKYTGTFNNGLSLNPITPVYILRDCYLTSSYLKGRIYYAKIYDSNLNLVRDFIPCKNPNGVCGLYDKVNKVFYGSASATPFTGA